MLAHDRLDALTDYMAKQYKHLESYFEFAPDRDKAVDTRLWDMSRGELIQLEDLFHFLEELNEVDG